jgi:hypothetical protein
MRGKRSKPFQVEELREQRAQILAHDAASADYQFNYWAQCELLPVILAALRNPHARTVSVSRYGVTDVIAGSRDAVCVLADDKESTAQFVLDLCEKQGMSGYYKLATDCSPPFYRVFVS